METGEEPTKNNCSNGILPLAAKASNESMQLEFRRPIYRSCEFQRKYKKEPPGPKSFKNCIKDTLTDACCCSTIKAKKFINSKLPFLKILRNYKWKADLPNDLVSGLTVGIMQLPQGK